MSQPRHMYYGGGFMHMTHTSSQVRRMAWGPAMGDGVVFRVLAVTSSQGQIPVNSSDLT